MPSNALSTEALSACPLPGEMLWHAVGPEADVAVEFNQLGKALATSAGLPSTLYLHSFIIRAHSSFFCAALDAAAVTSSPVLASSTLSVQQGVVSASPMRRLLYKFPMGAREADIMAFYYLVRTMYLGRFEDIAHVSVGLDRSEWASIVERTCTALGWDQGLSRVQQAFQKSAIGGGVPKSPVLQRKTHALPPLELMPVTPLTPFTPATTHPFPLAGVETLSSPAVHVPRPRRLSQLLAEELESPPSSPIVRVPTAVREAEIVRKEEEFGAVGDLGMVRRASPMQERRNSAGSLPGLGTASVKDVMAILNKINSGTMSSSQGEGMERRSSWNGIDPPRPRLHEPIVPSFGSTAEKEDSFEIPLVKEKSANLLVRRRSRGQSVSTGSDVSSIHENMTEEVTRSTVTAPTVLLVSPSSPGDPPLYPKDLSLPSSVQTTVHLRNRERRNSFQPPRPTADILAQCAEMPTDPAALKRRQLSAWVSRFENLALEQGPGAEGEPVAHEAWSEIVDGIVGSGGSLSRRGSFAEIQEVPLSQHFPATERESAVVTPSLPPVSPVQSGQSQAETNVPVRTVHEHTEGGEVVVTTTTVTTVTTTTTRVEKRPSKTHVAPPTADIVLKSPGIVVVEDDAFSQHGSPLLTPDAPIVEKEKTSKPIVSIPVVSTASNGLNILGSILPAPRLARQRRSSAPVGPAAFLTANPRPKSPLGSSDSTNTNSTPTKAPSPPPSTQRKKRPQTLSGLAPHLVDRITQLVNMKGIPTNDAMGYLLRILDALYVDSARAMKDNIIVVTLADNLEKSILSLMKSMTVEDILRLGRVLGVAPPAILDMQTTPSRKVEWKCDHVKQAVADRLGKAGWASLVIS